jgi:outer membrane protein OmpA-like peptidoglycan-associated protein
MSLRSRSTFASLVALLALPGALVAQGREVYKLPIPVAIGAETGRAQPGVTAASPIGFGPKSGDFFAGVGYQNTTRFGGGNDGSLSLGAGLGDPGKLAGLEFVVTSASTVRSGFFDRLYGAAKLHRTIGNGLGVAAGIEGVTLSGEATFDPSLYVVATKVQQIGTGAYFNSVTWNGGLGTKRFAAPSADDDQQGGVGLFASAAIKANASTSLIADYTGQDLNLGLSFAPFSTLPITISPAIVDLLGRSTSDAGEKSKPRLTLGIGFSYSGRKAVAAAPGEPGAARVLPAPDDDADGVPNTVDACPNTPPGTPVDSRGCPLPPPDDDNDGVPNAVDTCPNTPRGTAVDSRGCPLPPPDDDKDGVPNASDVCPNTPAGTKVDARGCPLPPPDADGDGVPDTADTCANTPTGTAVDMKGCPAIFSGAKSLVLKGVAFASGASTLLPASRPALDEVAKTLLDNPTVKVEIGGHTDRTGSEPVNARISLGRANAVRTYLISKGVAADRMTAKGYGSSKPVAPNNTPAGRATNRRVELTPVQ